MPRRFYRSATDWAIRKNVSTYLCKKGRSTGADDITCPIRKPINANSRDKGGLFHYGRLRDVSSRKSFIKTYSASDICAMSSLVVPAHLPKYLAWTNTHHFANDIFIRISLTKSFDFEFHKICPKKSNWRKVIIGSGNGLVLHWQQVITSQ